MEDLPLQKYSGFLMGDIHKRSFVKHQNCIVGYPGATDVVKKSDPLVTSCTVFNWDGKVLTEEKEIEVGSRETLARRVNSEEDMAPLIEEIRTKGARAKMFFVAYSALVENVSERLHIAAASGDSLVRCESFGVGGGASSSLAFANMTDALADQSTRSPASFVSNVFPSQSPLSKVAEALLEPEVDHVTIIRNFAATILQPSS